VATEAREKARRKRAAHLGPERRRPQVLDAALGLFLDRGYEGTSMDAIAAAAEVSKPVVYACFASKDELFRALLAREEERILAEIQAPFAEERDLSDPEATLIEGMTGFLRAVAASPDVYRLIFLQEGGGNAAVAKRVQRGREAQSEAMSRIALRWLEARGAAGVGDPQRSESAARMLGWAIAGVAEGGARLLLSDPDAWTPESLGRQLGRFAARGQAAI
jgi:AcrR family transcriptional regulator